MVRTPSTLPPTPRAVQIRAVLGRRWGLALVAFLLTVYGGAFGLLLWFHRGGKLKDDLDLDAGAAVTSGRVLTIEPTAARIQGQEIVRLTFEFEVPGGDGAFGPRRQDGLSFGEQGTLRAGAAVPIEYLPARPEVSRIQGMRITLVMDPGPLHARFVLLPGLALWIAYAAGVLRLRALLRHGDAAVAEVLAVRRLRAVVPEIFAVHYSFRDWHAQLRTGRDWVRVHGPLGRLVQSGQTRVPVVHWRTRPSRCHLTLAEDFVPAEVPA